MPSLTHAEIITTLLLFLTIATSSAPTKVGAFWQLSAQEIINDAGFQLANVTAREEFVVKYNKSLGDVVEVFSQVVAGRRYRILYQSQMGIVEASVVVQLWKKLVHFQKFQFVPQRVKPITIVSEGLPEPETTDGPVQPLPPKIIEQNQPKYEPKPPQPQPQQIPSTIKNLAQAFLNFLFH